MFNWCFECFLLAEIGEKILSTWLGCTATFCDNKKKNHSWNHHSRWIKHILQPNFQCKYDFGNTTQLSLLMRLRSERCRHSLNPNHYQLHSCTDKRSNPSNPKNRLLHEMIATSHTSHPFFNKPTPLSQMPSKRRLSLGSLLHLHHWHQARTDCSHESSSQQCTLRGEMLTIANFLEIWGKLQDFKLEHLMDCRHNMAKSSKKIVGTTLECCRVFVVC